MSSPWLAWLREVDFVVLSDVTFRVRETFFSFAKAVHAYAHAMDDESRTTARRIALAVLAAGPTEAKRATGRRSGMALDVPKWDAVAVSVMEAGAEQQIAQHDRLRDILLSTAGTYLAEANPWDARWGVGYGVVLVETAPRATWGANLHGRLLMRIRLRIEHSVSGSGTAGVPGHSTTEVGIG